MELAVQVLGVAVALALLWSGIRKLELNRFWAAALWVLDVAVLGASLYFLGWLGLALALGATAIGVLAWSIRLAMEKESLLVSAAIQAGVTREAMFDLNGRLRGSHRAFRQIGQIELVKLLGLLAQRACTPAELQQMAMPVAMLWIAQECDLAWLVEHFDRLLRLYGKPASNAMGVADTLTVATQRSAATFVELVEGMCSVGEPPSRDDLPAERVDVYRHAAIRPLVSTARQEAEGRFGGAAQTDRGPSMSPTSSCRTYASESPGDLPRGHPHRLWQ